MKSRRRHEPRAEFKNGQWKVTCRCGWPGEPYNQRAEAQRAYDAHVENEERRAKTRQFRR